MEINNLAEYASKRLHKHLVPVLLVAFAVFGLAFTGIAHYKASSSEGVVLQGLTKQTVHVKPTANGLGHVTIDTGAQKPSNSFSEAGRRATNTINFE